MTASYSTPELIGGSINNMAQNIKHFSLSFFLHIAVVSLGFYYSSYQSSFILPFNALGHEQVDQSPTSHIKEFLRTEAQTVSKSLLDKEIQSLKQAQVDQRVARENIQKEHARKLSDLKKQQQQVLENKKKAKEQLSLLEKDKDHKKKQINNLQKEVAALSKENEIQKQEQKKIKREQTFAENVLKESLYSDGSILRSYRDHLSAHISSFWNKAEMSTSNKSAECVLEIALLPTRRIQTVKIQSTSGNDVFDNSAIAAIRKAEPFPDLEYVAKDILPQKIRVVFKQDGCGVLDATS